MKLAIIGITGLVGNAFLKVLEERNFPISEFIPVASEDSVNKTIKFKNKEYKVISIDSALAKNPDIVLFSAGAEISLLWAEKFANNNSFVIDNSSAWRMDESKKLIIPEINAHILTIKDKIIANPNCSTIQMLMPLAPLHSKYKIKRIVVSTYQSISGTGTKAIKQLDDEREFGVSLNMAYKYQIDKNCIPQCDVFESNGYTKEEMKLVNETHKILDKNINVTATAVRIPVIGGHSESVNIEFEKDIDINEIRSIIANTKGVILYDDISNEQYPMPILSYEKDEVFVGRLRLDSSQKNTINMWIVADNIRKGAATNTIQIAEYLIESKLVKPFENITK